MKRRNFLKSLLGVPLGISLWPKKAKGQAPVPFLLNPAQQEIMAKLKDDEKGGKCIERLIDLGDPICPNCGRNSEWVWVEVRTGQQYSLMRFVGCDKCRRSGYMTVKDDRHKENSNRNCEFWPRV